MLLLHPSLGLLGLNKTVLEGTSAEQLSVTAVGLANTFLPSLKPKIVHLVPRNLLEEQL